MVFPRSMKMIAPGAIGRSRNGNGVDHDIFRVNDPPADQHTAGLWGFRRVLSIRQHDRQGGSVDLQTTAFEPFKGDGRHRRTVHGAQSGQPAMAKAWDRSL